MYLVDVIKKKIKLRNIKAFGMNYKEFCKIFKKCPDNDVFSDNALDKFARKNTDYPTKEEFEEHKRKIQQEELKSDRFKKIQKFIMEYQKRENIELERVLFKIVGTYGLEDNLINKRFDKRRIYKSKRYNELKKFMNSLSGDQINSNIYLKAAAMFMETSIIDCELIIRQLRTRIFNLELSDRNQSIYINIDIPKERLELFPKMIYEVVRIPYYRPQDYKMAHVNILDETNSYIYTEYNQYVDNIKRLSEDIYQLQMCNLLSLFPEQIVNYNFSIFNYECEFRTSFFVRKSRENIIGNETNSYQLSEKTKENISRVIGLSFDELENMSFEDLEKHIDQKRGERSTYDLRLRIDGIPMDEEHVITTLQVDRELDKNIDGPKLVLKRNK